MKIDKYSLSGHFFLISKSMDYQASLQSMKNEIIMELRSENQSVVEKLNIAQRSIDSQNSTIISLSEELKTVKNGKI